MTCERVAAPPRAGEEKRARVIEPAALQLIDYDSATDA
jgi:hypothetical protein